MRKTLSELIAKLFGLRHGMGTFLGARDARNHEFIAYDGKCLTKNCCAIFHYIVNKTIKFNDYLAFIAKYQLLTWLEISFV